MVIRKQGGVMKRKSRKGKADGFAYTAAAAAVALLLTGCSLVSSGSHTEVYLEQTLAQSQAAEENREAEGSQAAKERQAAEENQAAEGGWEAEKNQGSEGSQAAEKGQVTGEDQRAEGNQSGGDGRHVVLNTENGQESGKEGTRDGAGSQEKESLAPGENPDGEVSLVFAGDILFDESYAIMASMNQRGKGIEGGISGDLLERLRAADIFMVNNEFPYTDRGTPTAGKTFTFRAKPESASYLNDMGADLVSLANNHAYDYGEISLLDSLDTLNRLGIPYVGAGRNLEEASRPVYLTVDGLTIGFVAATQIERMLSPDTKGATETSAGVFRCLEIDGLLESVREAKENSDFVIAFVHWGTEGTDELDHWQLEQAPQIAEAGADLIIGAHPHVLQPVGYCGSVPVVYSLGNFLFNSRTLDTCIVEAVVDENGLKSLQFVPALQSGCRVSLAGGMEKERILQYMRDISPEASLDEEGYISGK